MFRLTIVSWLLLLALSAGGNASRYSDRPVYQIYTRSFKDSNGDGIGDLNGITSKLEHIADIGASAVLLSPIFRSPQADFGYDVSNYTDIDPEYGTLADFDRFVFKATSLGLRIILDFVPNHSSDQHPWFKKSVQRIKPYDEYYVWRNATFVNGTRQPPNNWLSVYQGSAWEWNEVRRQYYLHQFGPSQPDLNYRSAALNEEIKNVLTFWMNRSVHGFRIGAVNHLVEDARFLNEPSANASNVPKDDYDSLNHVYTKDQKENYEVLKSFKKHITDYCNRTHSEMKVILTEAYTDYAATAKYYEVGTQIPLNYMFVRELNQLSNATDFKRLIDRWMSSVPRLGEANWVVGSHDNQRVATRFGSKRADQIPMLAMILPGVAVVYNGDEIGMEDRSFTYNETRDIAGRRAGPYRYYLKSRDPERTPYQWDNSTSAGFSNRSFTWLPVNNNYKTLNLAAQKRDAESHYKVFKALSALKSNMVIAVGSLKVTVVNDRVLGVVRRLGSRTVALLINFSDVPITVNARNTLDLPSQMKIYTSSVGSNLRPGSWVFPVSLTLPGSASVVYVTSDVTQN